jgi:hypothetical protein
MPAMTLRQWRVTTSVVLVVVAAACSSSGRGDTTAERLPGGVRAPASTRLVGTAVPMILPGGDGSIRWTALLAMDGDPVATYRDVSGQAVRRGLGALPPARIACQSDYLSENASPGVPTEPGTDVRCEGSTDHDGRVLGVTVAACHSCAPRVSAAQLSYQSFPRQPLRRTELTTTVPQPHGSASEDSWPVLRGTRVLAQADLANCNGSRYTVLEVTGAPDDVWNRYLARYGSSTRFEPITKAFEATVAGARVRQSLGGTLGTGDVVTLVERPDLDHPVLSVDECSD